MNTIQTTPLDRVATIYHYWNFSVWWRAHWRMHVHQDGNVIGWKA